MTKRASSEDIGFVKTLTGGLNGLSQLGAMMLSNEGSVMLANKKIEHTGTGAARSSANANWLPAGNSKSDRIGGADQTRESVSMSLYQLIAGSLEGPQGLHPETFLAALGALAGYSARWSVRAAVAEGELDNDFYVPDGINRPHVLVSDHVNQKVSSLTGPSVASVLTTQLIQSGASWLPDINAALQHNFEAINSPTYPDYTVPKRHYPAIPPQTLLMMLWEKAYRVLRSVDGGAEMAPTALAGAAAHACVVHATKVPLAVSGQLVLESAIAMCKLDYAL